KDIYEASILYKQMTEKGIENDSYLFAALIYLRGILDDSEGARKTYDKMKAAGVIPNTILFNQLIYSHARDKKVNASQIEALYLEMLAEKLEPNHYTFELLIDAMSKRHAFAKICGVFNEMSQRNIPITNVAYNSPIRHHGLAGNTELAWKFFNRMISAGIEPSMYIYTSIISLATASSDFAIAIKAFKDLLTRGLKPNVHVYSALITALVKSGNTEKAIEMLHHMVNHGVSPNHITFTSLIQGFAIKRNYEKGKEMYEMMKKSNIIPDRFTFYHLEKLYKTTGHIEDIKELYEDIKRYGIDPQSRDRILIKGKGSYYWRSRILIKRRIERQKANTDPEEQYAIKKRQRKIWKRRNLIREAALQRLYSKLQSSQNLEPYPIWKKIYIQENYEDLQRYKKSGSFPF
ncbi:25242_t:CDS:1, partial [Dentiscutata erythropus]